jgi:predicted 3-demethylubiquinone-9 3-methyltransferase (glyoxalase superfamily)
MATFQKITPCLWFDDEAEPAVKFYTKIFPDSRTLRVTRYDKGRHKPEGSVLTIAFELAGQGFLALNGGPEFTFTPALSLIVACADQAEIDTYWDRLLEGGSPVQCGWLKDHFGLSWQIVPAALQVMLTEGSPEAASRVMSALMGMVKLDLAALQAAYEGKS